MTAALRLFVLVAAHPKLRSFVQLCAWSILSLGPKPPLHTNQLNKSYNQDLHKTSIQYHFQVSPISIKKFKIEINAQTDKYIKEISSLNTKDNVKSE
jgi:hypothetical protein